MSKELEAVIGGVVITVLFSVPSVAYLPLV